jgi:hypothetical protein
MGTMYITSVRIIWACDMDETYNISIPYLQIVRWGWFVARLCSRLWGNADICARAEFTVCLCLG